MKTIALVAALATMAACSPAAETEAPAEPAMVEETTAAMTAADGGPVHGNYRITSADGQVYLEEVREDGTWSSTDPEGVVTTGTWEAPNPNLYCVTDDAEGAQQVCHEETVDENGVWTTRDPTDGAVSTVERIEA